MYRRRWARFCSWVSSSQVLHGQGPEELERAYLDLPDGRIDPAEAHVFSLQG